MKVGDYVRTKKGIIGKIKLIDNQTELKDLYLIKRKWYYKEDFVKSSPNIIDLIEVGDYVNGSMVVNKIDDKILIAQLMLPYDLKEQDIKNVVTHEQFESMKYRIGE